MKIVFPLFSRCASNNKQLNSTFQSFNPSKFTAQSAFTCSKLIVETLVQGVKDVLVFLLLTLNM